MNTGRLYVVGIGPGDSAQMTPRAAWALTQSEVIAGYSLYLDLIAPLLEGKEIIRTAMRGERERCEAAVQAALSGRVVAVVSGGDAGVYGMAGLVLELAEPHPGLEVEVIPGVTAATAAAAVLGAPLGHDFAVISLSDLLTPWEIIEKRLQLCAAGDMVICLYNPSSKSREGYLARACAAILQHRDGGTPCGIVRQAGRIGQTHRILPLEELVNTPADMLTTVIVGSSRTRTVNGRLITPRGYKLHG